MAEIPALRTDRQNWSAWRANLEQAVNKLGISAYLSGMTPNPYDEQASALAKCTIASSVPDSLFLQILHFKSARECFKTLKILFEESTAINPDGTLKDASEITFYDSEGDDQPIPTHSINNPTSFQDQTSCAARGAKSQQDNLAASGAVPACKVAGTHQCKLAWMLMKNENTASTSTGSQKWKHPEEALDNATLTNSHRQPTAQHTAVQMLSSFLTMRTTLSETQAETNYSSPEY
ncbi:hypothetical protein BDN67DRAFT_985402 [Paxillus ammoniavirescens]|nr:hypothetical protein BDN67DRAFT_985402 [Paxillus ammoniavirescens]